MTRFGGKIPRLHNRNGQLLIQPTNGPMARTVDDCIELMKVLTSAYVRSRDLSLPPIPFTDPYSFGNTSSPTYRKLKIAYMVRVSLLHNQNALCMAGRSVPCTCMHTYMAKRSCVHAYMLYVCMYVGCMCIYFVVIFESSLLRFKRALPI